MCRGDGGCGTEGYKGVGIGAIQARCVWDLRIHPSCVLMMVLMCQWYRYFFVFSLKTCELLQHVQIPHTSEAGTRARVNSTNSTVCQIPGNPTLIMDGKQYGKRNTRNNMRVMSESGEWIPSRMSVGAKMIDI